MVFMVSCSSSRSKVKATSSAVNRSPSVHRTSSLRVIDSWVPSSFQEKSVPRSGSGSS
jgi:hypothetical protein